MVCAQGFGLRDHLQIAFHRKNSGHAYPEDRFRVGQDNPDRAGFLFHGSCRSSEEEAELVPVAVTGASALPQPVGLDPFEVVFIDHHRYALSCSFFGKSHHATLALHQHRMSVPRTSPGISMVNSTRSPPRSRIRCERECRRLKYRWSWRGIQPSESSGSPEDGEENESNCEVQTRGQYS